MRQNYELEVVSWNLENHILGQIQTLQVEASMFTMAYETWPSAHKTWRTKFKFQCKARVWKAAPSVPLEEKTSTHPPTEAEGSLG